MKTDPISLLVYAVIFLMLYIFIGIIVSVFIMILSLPIFIPFRKYTFDNNPLNFVPFALWKICYATTILCIMCSIFAVVMFFVLIIYIIWKILKTFGIIGDLFINIIPPLKQFDDAGIFKLIDNMIGYLPLPIFKMITSMFVELIRFTKDKIIDIATELVPSIKLEPSKIDELLSKVKENNVEHFENAPVSPFITNTKDSIKQNNNAEKYKNNISILPDMEMSERLKIVFNNEFKKIDTQLRNIQDDIKLYSSVVP